MRRVGRLLLIVALAGSGCVVQPSYVRFAIEPSLIAPAVDGSPEVYVDVQDRRMRAEVALGVFASPNLPDLVAAAAAAALRQRGFRAIVTSADGRALRIAIQGAWGHGHYGLIVPWSQNVARAQLLGKCVTPAGVLYRRVYVANEATKAVVLGDPDPAPAVLVGRALASALEQLVDDERMAGCLAGAPP
jgi:hypothetical protein